MRSRVERGDWQTPPELAREVVAILADHHGLVPDAVIEPTCGRGAFLVEAARRWPAAKLFGLDIDPHHVAQARKALADHARATLVVGDFFFTPWERILAEGDGELLLLGNPPWVTSAAVGALGGSNLPPKDSRGMRGIDALTGKSNFDVSEWMILRLLRACAGRRTTLAMLCKAAVARKVMAYCAKERLCAQGELHAIDARRAFDAAVEAVLFVLRLQPGRAEGADVRWPVFPRLGSRDGAREIGVIDGILVADVAAFERTRHLLGDGPAWRSGIKHDCARVVELRRTTRGWVNGFGEEVSIEPDLVYPLLKGSDVANDRLVPSRWILVTQRRLVEDTSYIQSEFPRTWTYLGRHASAFAARKSRIYSGRPPFAIFGVGDYTFAPWKLAICGLYKRLRFQLVGPFEGKPVVFDDTCYFLPFWSEEEARSHFELYTSNEASEFFRARIFWDAKRPIRRDVLQSLCPRKLARAKGREEAFDRTTRESA